MSLAGLAVTRSGRPLIFLLIALAGWTSMRISFGSLPFVRDAPVEYLGSVSELIDEFRPRLLGAERSKGNLGVEMPTEADGVRSTNLGRWQPEVLFPGAGPALLPPGFDVGPVATPRQRPAVSQPLRLAASHNLMWMAAMSQVPVPREIAHLFDRARSAPPIIPSERQHEQLARRAFSFSSWLFLRAGREDYAGNGASPFYGRSQVGAIANYRLSSSSAAEPAAYLRADAALVSRGERQLAAGLSLRPISSLPVRVHVEARATQQSGRTELRPSAFVTAGTDAAPLPAGFAARSYIQAGYVGGRFSSAFADGQLVATREVARFDLGALRAGVGAWGGAQRGAHRLDIGPSLNLSVQFGETPASVSLDYRVRVAGDAAPGSGAALTLSRVF